MITKNQRHMLNYAFDHTFYIYGQEEIPLKSYGDKTTLATYFNNYLDHEVTKDAGYYILRGEPVDSFREGAREMVNMAYFEAMREFVDNIGNTLIGSSRSHRVKLRGYFMNSLKRRILERERILEGKAKVLDNIRKEREGIQRGE